ncbi:hypothetical protein KR200_011334, partial [Drosophila serrata]
FRSLLSILCLILAYSCAQGWNFALEGTQSDSRENFSSLVAIWTCSQTLGGGSLISNHVVLTAWKPFEDRNVSEIRVSFNPSMESFKEYGVKSIVRHPNFSRTSGAYNLALLFLKKPVKFTTEIQPITLATLTSVRNLDLTQCIAKGSGMGTFPMQIVPTATCQQDFRRWLGASFEVDGSLMCAGGGVGRNMCEQDGYPLV